MEAAQALPRWKRTFLVERTLIRPAAAGKLQAAARHRGAEATEGEAGGREVAAAAEEA